MAFRFSLAALFLCFCTINLVASTIVSHDGRAITIDGIPRVLLSGSIHYPRSTPQMWPDLIKKSKEGGLDAIETYVFWNAHEPSRRQYDFNDNLDLVSFIKTIQDEGLYVVLRIGPYVCAEWNYGGFPVWLHNVPGCEMRTANSVFMNEMQNFTTLIVDMMKQHNLFASQGGPIILAQVENEYGNIMDSYGAAGKAYIDWCANMAESLDIGVPWIMCQQTDAPQPMINTCNGWYCDQFTPNNANSPKMWTENWTGWFKSWGGKVPHRTAEDLAFAVARFFQTGGTFQNYYMYHGGTNFGRTAGGPFITTSYDYDAPLDEYGNLNQPKWGHLKQLHDILHSIEYTLTHGNISTIDYDNSVTVTLYASEKESSCFFSNGNETSDATIDFEGTNYDIPAWSVSILPDCKNVGYNTAKVKTQTSTMVKKKNEAEDEPSCLKWYWMPENIQKTAILGKGQVHASQLIDQKDVTNDVSDYLWYMTSVHLSKDDRIWSRNMSLRVNGTGHVLHAYVNGENLGIQYKSSNVLETSVKLKHGRNIISLLSSTVGLQNYGYQFDMGATGIPGPVELIGQKGDEKIIKDLSSHKWTYSVGLKGFDNELFSSNSPHASKWLDQDLPTNRTMTWYKTTFKAPLGKDPVVLNLQGMGKGFAWVNGNNIGRYWPSYVADEDGCSNEVCDYRGAYDNNKCLTNCGNPTQIWYHVPRSFFVENDDVNTLVLFEEFGGNPAEINFQTITAGEVSVSGSEGETVDLSCNDKPISAIKFASFGDPQVTNVGFIKGSCEGVNDASSIIHKACVGKEACKIQVSKDIFGSTSCGGEFVNILAIEAVC
ncbi:beta-galactosidase 15-like [Mercurialis annua]|uniref:beta-galactosidase 15-like n=1 Tax=Mercurialis annua TaxID=3986 RepID=UPI0021609F9B|nr:beta-galactosidase 15-like [Mercurialis annua]